MNISIFPFRPRSATLALALGSLLTVLAPPGVAAQYDLLIRGGRILDGSGNPWFFADVAITADRVAAVGDLSGATARRVVDARGLYVAPGFVDIHSHAAGGLSSPELSHARPLLAQGVATVIVNPDGGGSADLANQKVELLADGLGVNVGLMVPHGSVRREVIGSADRLASEEELDRMRDWVRRGMEEGALGLSSGPFYAPGSYSDTRELVELAKVAAEYGGSYTSHIRDEASYSIGVVAAVEEVIAVARGAGLPAVWTHAKALGPSVWGFSGALVRRVELAREEGLEVYADQYPYEASATSLSAALIPRWAQGGGGDSLRARLERPDTRARILSEMHENLARRGGADRIQFRSFGPDASIEGRRLHEVAAEAGRDPVDVALDLILEGGPSIVSFNMDEGDIRTLMVQPWTMTASDGGLTSMGAGVPHPRNYGTFPRKIRRYVVEESVLPLEAAIRSMTSLPAQVFRLPDRGMIRPGFAADVVVFDLATFQDVATFTDPHHLAEGVVQMWVNGEAVIRDSEFTSSMPGRILTRN